MSFEQFDEVAARDGDIRMSVVDLGFSKEGPNLLNIWPTGGTGRVVTDFFLEPTDL